uniref:Uncharacterized protein n=1 Tax=Siphoviridae sp. ctoiW10 TaxID=2827592 RepID=A0A8S5LP67_9CAUD|nr:MAG TPA: hypothetical protein [Siphoviridae sp. ctoiW10]
MRRTPRLEWHPIAFSCFHPTDLGSGVSIPPAPPSLDKFHSHLFHIRTYKSFLPIRSVFLPCPLKL